MFTLFNTLVYLLLLAVGLVLLGAVIYKSVAEGGDAAEHATAYTLAVAGLLLLVYGWMLATFLPGLAVRVRRLHDIGLSGKWLLGYYALYWVCFYWMSTSYMQFAEDGALEGLSGQQSAAAIWIVVRPMLLALALLSAAGIAAMFRERGESVWRRSHGGDSGGGRRGCGVCYGSFNLKSIAYEMVVDLY